MPDHDRYFQCMSFENVNLYHIIVRFYQMKNNNKKLCGYCLTCFANTAKQEKYRLSGFLGAHKASHISKRVPRSETILAATKLSPVGLNLGISEFASKQSITVSFRNCLK